MRSSSFLSSHPTGLPTGMTPVIVDQSPELPTRSVFEGHSYQEELELRNELMPKSASSISNYGIAEIPLRARDPTHDLGNLQYSQGSYDGNAMSTSTFDSGRSQSQGLYPDGLASSRPSTSDESDYPSLMGNYSVKIVEWGPQEGAPGTSVQATIISPFRINNARPLYVTFGRIENATICTPVGDGSHPYRYVISFQATAQHPSQWTKSKSLPLSMYVPFEGFDQAVTLDLGSFMYTDGSTPPTRPDSGSGRKRRTSSVGYDPRTSASVPIYQDADMSGRPAKARYSQLPPIRSNTGASARHTLQTGSYSSSSLHDEYQSQHGTGVSNFYQPMLSSYNYSSACTPPTPSWASSASSLTLGSSVNTVSLTNDAGSLNGSNPRFVRRRNDQIASISTPGTKSSAAAFNPYGMYPNHKAMLRLDGDLSSMTRDWTAREKSDKRRLVHFTRVQTGSAIQASFRPVDPDQKEPNLTLISCIWREDRNECYVTSVDTISLLEALVTPDTAFTVEEKNRIRRNLEGFHPETISKQKPQNEEFFKQIMGYPPPRPRHIEKDVKVFKWSTLEVALKKIISKYCASYASTADAPRRQVGEGHYTDGSASLQAQGLTPTNRSGMSTNAQYAVVPSHGHAQQIPMSAASSTFSDYAHGYSQYPSALAGRYSQYADQSQYSVHDGSGVQTMLQSHQQQQSRPAAIGFNSDWSTHQL